LQKFLARLFARLMKSWSWILLILLTILIKWASWYPGWVEQNYSNGVYPVLSRVQRILFGWIPVSVGDLFYAFLVLVIIFKTARFFKLLFRRQLTRSYFGTGLQQAIFFMLFVYVFFNLFWGLNYNRKGIAYKLDMEVKTYSVQDLDTLTSTMVQRINFYAARVSEAQRDSFNRKKTLFNAAAEAYTYAAKQFPFLNYQTKSLKPSLFSYLGNYLGFQGYYNPFSGEGQVNTTIPRFFEPFVATHEIAHLLGFAKENEANFVGFLACRAYPNDAFRYSVYFDMFNYAIGEMFLRDTALGKKYYTAVHPQVIADRKEWRRFHSRYSNPVEPVISWGYGQFLRANNQPLGKKSYNEVVASLIAYYKKFGIDAL